MPLGPNGGANMRWPMTTLLTLTVLLFWATPAAPQSTCSSVDTDTVIYFGNGVWTDFDGAVHSRIALENAVRPLLGQTSPRQTRFDIAFNASHGKFADLFEAALQDLGTDATQFWRTVFGLRAWPDSLSQAALDLATEFESSIAPEDETRHLADYRKQIAEGKRVLVVAHSQGNFFANRVFNSVASTSFRIVSVANPDSFVAGNGDYTTQAGDLVIEAVRVAKQAVLLPEPLPSNASNGLVFFGDFPLRHGFVDAYLGGSATRTQVLDQAVDALQNLPFPSGTVTQGVITVTLTWGIEPDVDLHSFEPNGTHVYYRMLRGLSGYLDLDDITSFGPEHYYVPCRTLEEGTYRFGVNYYRGSAPEMATIQVDAGSDSRFLTKALNSARGSAGDGSPVLVADVRVSRDPVTGEYVFVIIPW